MDGALPEKAKKSLYNWPLLGQFAALFLVISILFQNSVSPLFARWIKWDQDLSHALPTIAALLYLISRKTDLPYREDSRHARIFLCVLLSVFSLIWCFFSIANITILANIALLLCIPAVVAISYSTLSSRFLLPIVGMLIFTLPVFSQFNDVLVWMSAKAVGFLVELVGMTALLDGQNIFIPSGHIYIADGCSGLRYFTISILLGYILSILNNYNFKEALFALAIAIALGLLTNWLRIFLLVIIGDLTEMKSSLMHDHEMFGWVLFSCVAFPTIFFAPIKHHVPTSYKPAPQIKPIPALVALAIGPALIALIPGGSNSLSQFTLNSLKATLYRENPSFELKLPEEGIKESAKTIVDDINLYVSLAEYRPANLKEKMIPYFENIYNKEEWRTTQEANQELEQLGFKTLVLSRPYKSENLLLLYRFEVGSYNTNDYQLAKLFQIPATFAGKRYSNFFSIHTPCRDETCSKEREAATKLAIQWDQNTKALR